MVKKLQFVQNGSYTLGQKAAAFCKGLVRCEPLVEVALTGLKQSGLSESRQNKYALRIVRKGSRNEQTALSAYEAVGSGAVTSEMAQDKLAHVFRAWHEQTKRELSLHPIRTERGLVNRHIISLPNKFRLALHLDSVVTLADGLITKRVLTSEHALQIFTELAKSDGHQEAAHLNAYQSANTRA